MKLEGNMLSEIKYLKSWFLSSTVKCHLLSTPCPWPWEGPSGLSALMATTGRVPVMWQGCILSQKLKLCDLWRLKHFWFSASNLGNKGSLVPLKPWLLWATTSLETSLLSVLLFSETLFLLLKSTEHGINRGFYCYFCCCLALFCENRVSGSGLPTIISTFPVMGDQVWWSWGRQRLCLRVSSLWECCTSETAAVGLEERDGSCSSFHKWELNDYIFKIKI